MSDLSVFFQSVKLPVMPEVAHALIRTLHEEDIVLGDVRNIVAKDPVLTAKVLRAANSAALGLRREVSTLDDAIAMIGMAQVRTLALTACMNVAFPVAAGLDRTAFWRRSMACAAYAQWLALASGSDSQEAWLAGMMVCLGELIVAQTLPERLAELWPAQARPGSRWQHEQAVLGFSAAHVSAELARRWRFPDRLVRALNTACEPLATEPFCTLGGVLHLASQLADAPANQPPPIEALPAAILVRLGLQSDWLCQHLPGPETFFDISAL